MKKLLIVLGMITCILGMTACGSKAVAEENVLGITEESAISYADNVVETINGIVTSGAQSQYESDPVISAALDSWSSALEDMGDYQSITGHTVDISEREVIINVEISGTAKAAVAELIIDEEGALVSVTANVKRSFGELMENALLNTLLGMGTVFVVLILIAWIISLFGHIPRLQAKFQKKPAVAETAPAPAPTASIQEVAAEDLSDDSELVAVIAAAIAASEGAVTTDGFVVRSIRKANKSKWQRA